MFFVRFRYVFFIEILMPVRLFVAQTHTHISSLVKKHSMHVGSVLVPSNASKEACTLLAKMLPL